MVFPLVAPPGPAVLAAAIVLQTTLYYAAIAPLMAIGTAAGPPERAAPLLSSAIVLGAALGPGLGGFLHVNGAMQPVLAVMFAAAAAAVASVRQSSSRNPA